MTIKKKVGETQYFTGGAEETVKATIEIYRMPASMNDGEKTIRLSAVRFNFDPKDMNTLQISPGTMRAILEWAEKE